MKIVKHKHDNKTLDTLAYVIGPLIPLLTLPQVYNVLILKETKGVSLITWGFYLFSSSIFAFFGIKHKEKLLIITYVPFVIIEFLIVTGIIINK